MSAKREKNIMIENTDMSIYFKNLAVQKKIAETGILLQDLENMFSELDLLKNDPEYFIFEYISNIKHQIDVRREELKKDVDEMSISMINLLDRFRTDCANNLKKDETIKFLQNQFDDVKQKSSNCLNICRLAVDKNCLIDDQEEINSILLITAFSSYP